MKIRNGFVSNSSSSSFTCSVCGGDECGYDMSYRELGMISCKNGHIIHEECMDKDVLKEIVENSVKKDFDTKYCPICQFKSLDYCDALKYLDHVLGYSDESILENLKCLYGNYDKFLAETNIIISKKMEEASLKK